MKKTIVITFLDGSVEKSSLGFTDPNGIFEMLISQAFNCAWHAKDKDENFVRITNMNHVRSVHIIDDEEGENDSVED